MVIFLNDMIVCIKSHKESTDLGLINEVSNTTRYKVYMQIIIVFLYSNKTQKMKNFKLSFTSFRNSKHLETNLTISIKLIH